MKLIMQIDPTTDNKVNHLSDHAVIAFQFECHVKLRKVGRIIYPNTVLKLESFIGQFKVKYDQSPHLNPMERFLHATNESAKAAKCYSCEIGGRKKLFALRAEDHKVYVDMLSEAHRHKGRRPAE